jgi:hypothetical protein
MKDSIARQARDERRRARQRRKETRLKERENRRVSMRAAMSSHREFMDELADKGNKVSRVTHPLASVLTSTKSPARVASAVNGFFDRVMDSAVSDANEEG